MYQEIYDTIIQLQKQGQPAAVATIVHAEGSVPRGVGTKMLVKSNGEVCGTIGGGLIESKIIADAKEVIKSGKPQMFKYVLNQTLKEGLPMLCGGNLQVFIEPIVVPPTLYILGAGHIAQPLSRLAKIIGFRVIVVDDREEYAQPSRFPETDEVVCSSFTEYLQNTTFTKESFVVIITRGHQYDEQCVRACINKGAKYIGMIGSRQKVQQVFTNLINSGISEKMLQKVHAPIGLDIGGETPQEIALSIITEVVAIKYDKKNIIDIASKRIKFKQC